MVIPNQELNQWQPGQSGNPSGRKKSSKNRSTILKKWLELNCIIADPTTEKEISGTIDNGIAIALIRKTIAGVTAIRELWARLKDHQTDSQENHLR